MIARGLVPFTSDQAISSLMAMHIVETGEHPVFYWGVEYGGTLEPHLLSLVFGILPPTFRTYRLVMLALAILTVTFLTAAVAIASGRLAARRTALVLGLGPVYLFFKALSSDGAYGSLLFLTAAGTLLVAILASTPPERPVSKASFLLGLTLGLAFWVHLAGLPAIVALGGIGTWSIGRRGSAPHVALLLGGAVGSAPWWIRNLRTDFASLRMNELASVTLSDIGPRFATAFRESLPIVLGPMSFRSADVPGAAFAAGALLMLLVALAVVRLRETTFRSERALMAVALLFVGASLAAFVGSAHSTTWEPRYLLPVLPASGLILGSGLKALPSSRLRSSVVLCALGLSAASHAFAPRLRNFQRRSSADGTYQRIIYADAGKVLAAFEHLGVRHFLGGYWTVYRLMFLSRMQVRGSCVGRIVVDRMPWVSREVRASRDLALVLEGDDRDDFEALVQKRGWKVSSVDVDDLRVFYDLPDDARAFVSKIDRLPPR